jgi:hypothetical protein
MHGAAVPKAAIDEDRDAVPGEGYIYADVPLTSDNGDIVSEAEASSMQGGPERHLGLRIATAVGPHDVAYGGVNGRGVVDS